MATKARLIKKGVNPAPAKPEPRPEPKPARLGPKQSVNPRAAFDALFTKNER